MRYVSTTECAHQVIRRESGPGGIWGWRDRAGGGGVFSGRSAAVEEAVQDAGAELEGGDRYALVHAVEHAGEVQISRKPQRGEPEAAHAEPAERLRVGPAGQAVRDDPDPRILVQEGRGHRVAQVTVERGLQGDVMVDELALHARAQQGVHPGEALVLVTRQEPPVQIRRGDLPGQGEARKKGRE